MNERSAPSTPVVPAEAIARLAVCDADRHLHDRAEACVAAIAVPVLAVELRRLAAAAATPGDLEARAEQLETWAAAR